MSDHSHYKEGLLHCKVPKPHKLLQTRHLVPSCGAGAVPPWAGRLPRDQRCPAAAATASLERDGQAKTTFPNKSLPCLTQKGQRDNNGPSFLATLVGFVARIPSGHVTRVGGDDEAVIFSPSAVLLWHSHFLPAQSTAPHDRQNTDGLC